MKFGYTNKKCTNIPTIFDTIQHYHLSLINAFADLKLSFSIYKQLFRTVLNTIFILKIKAHNFWVKK